MTRLEAFKKSAMGAAVAAVLASSLSPAVAQPSGRHPAMADRQARLQARDEFRTERRRDAEALRAERKRLDRQERALEEVSDRLERRSWELEFLMKNYRAMNDGITWALEQAGGSLSAEDSLGVAANVREKHIGAIEAHGISAFPDASTMTPGSVRLHEAADSPGLVDGLHARIEELARDVAMRSMAYAEEGRAVRTSALMSAILGFASGEAYEADAHPESFRAAVEAPSFR